MQKTNRLAEKIIKRKGNKLFVKWKRHNNSFNSWIDKKYIELKQVIAFLNHSEILEQILMLNLIFQIKQPKQISSITMLILQVLHLKMELV